MDLERRIVEDARRLGAAGVGICGVDAFDEVAATMHHRKREGSSAGLAFTYRDPDVATDVTKSFPWARRLVVAAHSYAPESGSPGPAAAGTGRIARFATEDHYVPLRNLLGVVASTLRAAGHRGEVLVDDSRLVDRAAAVRAGVGWWGKSTLVLVPGAGPWVLLGSVVTDAQLAVSTPMLRDCGTCDACLPACPTGAITAPGMLDARLCLAYWAQSAGVIPRELRRPMGDRVYGCDACLDACPPGHPALRIASPDLRGRIDLIAALALDDATLLSTYAHFYVPKRRVRTLRRNMLIALGNGGDEAAIPVLSRYLESPDWILRVHAVWALAALLGFRAGPILEAAAATERNADVLAEIQAARAGWMHD